MTDNAAGFVFFLSHSDADSEEALKLASRLEETPEVRERGFKFWIDKRDLVPGRDWQAQLEQAIERARGFLVYVGSCGTINWVEREVRLGLSRAAVDREYLLVPIISSQCKSVEDANLPAFISLYQAVREIETDPAQFQKLVRALLGEPDMRRPVRVVDTPFVGLRSFDVAHAHLFFGRNEEIDRVLEELKSNPLLMVVGDSGSGKSSLIKAGVIPKFLGGALEDCTRDLPDDRAWVCIEMRPAHPARDPFENLAKAVYDSARAKGESHSDSDNMRTLVRSRDPARVRDALQDAMPRNAEGLLYVDQFEELLTLCQAEHRTPFVNMLRAIASEGKPTPLRVLMSMRWDYYNLCSQYPAFYQAVERAKHPIAPMERSQLLSCIVEPLKLAGRGPGEAQIFGERVFHDISGEPRDLALMQMALYQTWRELSAHGGDLHAAYEAAGLVSGALAQEAERVYEKVLTDEERSEAEPLLLRLVRLGDTGGVTRRVVPAEVLSLGALAVAQKLASDECGHLLHVRAISTGEQMETSTALNDRQPRFITVELTHEKLATQWPRYQGWLQEASRDKRVHDSLIGRARLWVESPVEERAKHLLTGGELDQAEALGANRPTWLSKSERALVDESLAARERQIEKERKVTRVIRSLSVIVFALAIAAFAFALWAWKSARDAEERLTDIAWANAVAHRGLLNQPLQARH